LDRLLQHKAKQGVLIYVVLYKEVGLGFALNSEHSKNTLRGLHKNIFGESVNGFCLKPILMLTCIQSNGILTITPSPAILSSGLIMR
jgi:hypothetical protein